MNKDSKRKAEVFYQDTLAGTLQEGEQGFIFEYDDEYIAKKMPPISMSIPLTTETFTSKTLFPFFLGIIPEGWFKDIVCMKLKIDPSDAFGLLLATAKENTIGAVTVKEVK